MRSMTKNILFFHVTIIQSFPCRVKNYAHSFDRLSPNFQNYITIIFLT